MENSQTQLAFLGDLYAHINLVSFCAEYELNYDYVRQVLSGKKKLTEKKYQELLSAMQEYLRFQNERIALGI